MGGQHSPSGKEHGDAGVNDTNLQGGHPEMVAETRGGDASVGKIFTLSLYDSLQGPV